MYIPSLEAVPNQLSTAGTVSGLRLSSRALSKREKRMNERKEGGKWRYI